MSTSLESWVVQFNPEPTITRQAIDGHQSAIIVDDFLLNPQDGCAHALSCTYNPAPPGTYPGLWSTLPPAQTAGFIRHLNFKFKDLVGFRRVLDATIRFSLVTLPPAALLPSQWQCHQDRVNLDPQRVLFAASVLYLYDNPTFGGTSFYRPKRPPSQTDAMIVDSQTLSPDAFRTRYGVQAGYMVHSNDWFELITHVPARFNRFIIYDGSIFHSGHIEQPALLSSDPSQGRLSLNGFYTLTRPLVP